jgi:hypothetical protein
MSKEEEEIKKAITFLIFIAFILAVLGGILFSPGMLLVTVIRRVFSLSLDKGQMWVFSFLSSLLILGTFWSVLSAVFSYSTVEWRLPSFMSSLGQRSDSTFVTRGKNPPSSVLALVLYLGLSLLIVIVSLILYFGFHVKFPAEVLQSLIGWPNNI